MIILVLAGWVAAPHSGLGLIGVLRTAAVLWLVGHHVAVQVSDAGRIGMLPLGLVALPGALLWRAGRARRRPPPGQGPPPAPPPPRPRALAVAPPRPGPPPPHTAHLAR